MSKVVSMSEVFNREDDYYTEEYQKSWRNDLELLERITKDCTTEELHRIYDMINGETWEFMDLVAYLIRGRDN